MGQKSLSIKINLYFKSNLKLIKLTFCYFIYFILFWCFIKKKCGKKLWPTLYVHIFMFTLYIIFIII